MSNVEKNNFDELIESMPHVHSVLQNSAAKAVDQFLYLYSLILLIILNACNMSTPKYGRQYLPKYYFEGEELRIAQSIYEGETSLLNNLSKEAINKISHKGMSLFLYTIFTDNEEAMNILLKKGGDANMFTEVKSFQSEYWHKTTPLSMASQRPQISYIKTLLSYNVDINDNRANPALLNAIMRNDRVMVDYLLDNGADIHIQQKVTKENVLIKAADIHDFDMVNHLLDRGANPMLRDVSGDCLAFTVQHQINRGRGTEKYKKTLYDLKKRMEGMGVVFPVQKIPPKEGDVDTFQSKPVVPLSPSPSPTAPVNQAQNPNKKKWSILFDEDDDVVRG